MLPARVVGSAGLCLLLLLSGCTGEPTSYEAHQFKSTDELAKVVESKAGWTCSRGMKDDESGTAELLGKYGFAFMPCSNGSVTIISSDAKRAELAANPGNALKPGHARLDGGNWSVWGQQYQVEAARKVLGGKLTLEQ